MPKKDSEDRRVILDLSFPKCDSVKDHVSKDFYLGERINLPYLGVDDLVDIIQTKGRICYLFKCDLRRAYRFLMIDPGDASVSTVHITLVRFCLSVYTVPHFCVKESLRQFGTFAKFYVSRSLII